ncbi:serine hydrolase domain-containing protein [Pediococcus siamensis]|uniref:serine hydrolase domain-containing protein n=1 Tax=Pediococcus siamensis TaxID=381829 RepID=UPI0039A341F1
MKRYLGRLIIFGLFIVVVAGGIRVAYLNYQADHRADPTFFSGATQNVPKRKLVPKTFTPKRILMQQPQLKGKKRQIQRQLNAILGNNQFVGTVLIVKNNYPIYSRGYGYANFEKAAVNQAQSEYQILSMQKSLTATLIMQQVQAGKLALTDHLAKFYPQVPGANQITIRMMLNMMTGLRIHKFSTKALSGQDVVKYTVKHVRFKAAANKRWSYQPVNFTLLAGVLQKVTHRTYYALFKKVFIKQLHLKHTGFVMQAQQAKWLSTPYHNRPFTDNTINYKHVYREKIANQHNELATGNVYMDALDFYHVSQKILQNQFLTAQNTAMLHDAQESPRGYAGGLYQKYGTSYWSHGVGYGEESGMMISKDGRNAVVMLSNYHLKKSQLVAQCQTIYANLMQGNY